MPRRATKAEEASCSGDVDAGTGGGSMAEGWEDNLRASATVPPLILCGRSFTERRPPVLTGVDPASTDWAPAMRGLAIEVDSLRELTTEVDPLRLGDPTAGLSLPGSAIGELTTGSVEFGRLADPVAP